VNIETRWKDHQYKYRNPQYARHFYSALRKYGFEAFEWEWLGTLENWAEGCKAEKFFIAQGLTHYNKTAGGEGMPGTSAGFLGRHHTEETKAKISAAHKGKPRPQSVKDKLSAAKLGKPAHNKGKKMPEGTGAKISAKLKGRVSTRKGAVLTDETKKRISLSKTGAKQSPENVAKRVATRYYNRERNQLLQAMGPVVHEVRLDG
jgi:group I intron endonuclease